MKIDVNSIAKLAKLKMNEAQMKDFEAQFEKILEYFSKLQAVKTEGVEPLVTPFETYQNLRDDEVINYDSYASEVIKSSEFTKDRLFVVPPVVGGE